MDFEQYIKKYSQTRTLTETGCSVEKSLIFVKFIQNGKGDAHKTQQMHYFLPSDLSCNAEKQSALSSAPWPKAYRLESVFLEGPFTKIEHHIKSIIQ